MSWAARPRRRTSRRLAGALRQTFTCDSRRKICARRRARSPPLQTGAARRGLARHAALFNCGIRPPHAASRWGAPARRHLYQLQSSDGGRTPQAGLGRAVPRRARDAGRGYLRYVSALMRADVGSIMTNSGKCAYYAPGNLGVESPTGRLPNASPRRARARWCACESARFDAVTLVPGSAAGPVLRLDEPLSFWGGLDSATGTIIDRLHPQQART